MPTTQHRVLLVEDNPGDAELTNSRLAEVRAPRFDVRHVHSLSDATSALARGGIDAILLDLNLPDSTGIGTLRDIVNAARGIPVVVLSGLTNERLRHQATAAGALEVFAKEDANSPLFASSLLYVIERDRARAQHRQIEGLLDATPDAILVVQRSGIARFVNRAALELFGRSREDLVGELLGFSVKDGEPTEIVIPRRDGERICEMRVVPFEWDGEPGFLAAIRDLTDLKRSQQDAIDKQGLAEDHAGLLRRMFEAIASLALRHGLSEVAFATSAALAVGAERAMSGDLVAATLGPFDMAFHGYVDANRRLAMQNRELADAKAATEAANRELEAFSYSVAHDLHAPLRRIKAFSTILVEEFGDQLQDAAREHLARIHDQTQRMSQLIDDMLALARITRADLRRSPVDLSRIARSIDHRLREASPARSVFLTTADGLIADADRGLVQIVLENLLGNAYKFTARRTNARIELGVVARDHEVVYFVRDNGAGFDPASAHQLFGVFQRLHPQSEFGGTGIGLNIVKRIVERHGGRVWAEGAVEEGATFYFTLAPPAPSRGAE